MRVVTVFFVAFLSISLSIIFASNSSVLSNDGVTDLSIRNKTERSQIISLDQVQTIPIDSDTATKKLLLFSNNGCGKCSIAQQYFDNNRMPYEKFTIKENRPLMYEYVHKKTGGKNVGVGYPLLVYGDSVYFSINNINAVLAEIQQMMKEDGIIENDQKTQSE